MAEYTLYHIHIFGGDDTQSDDKFDTESFVIDARTLVKGAIIVDSSKCDTNKERMLTSQQRLLHPTLPQRRLSTWTRPLLAATR